MAQHVAYPGWPAAAARERPALERAATRDWLSRYTDQDFSLTDAVSFAVMTGRGVREALSLDNRFVVAGFRTLPAR